MPKKREDGRYEIKVRISRQGEPLRYKAVYGSTLKEARDKADKLKADISQALKRTQNYTVADAIEYWLQQKEKTVRPQTLKNYRYALRYAVETIGDRRISSVTVDDARQLHEQVAEYSVVQSNRLSNRMYAVFQDAIARGIITDNPFRFVTPYRYEQGNKRALVEEELKWIDNTALLPADRALLSVLRYTGMRRGEATALYVSDIHFDENYINIDKTNVDGKIGPTKTKKSIRKVPMPEKLSEILRDYLDLFHDGNGLLFPSLRGTPLCIFSFNLRWKRIADAIYNGMPPRDFTPHIFRHTYASELVKHHIPPTTAMLLLGHKSLSTTMGVYVHFGWSDIDTKQVTNIFS